MPAGGPRPGRGDQRSRLLDAIVAIVGRDGYLQAKIGDIAERAGVSRATFYELFEDKEECFLAAHRERAERIGAEIGQAVAKGEPSDATRAAVAVLVELADREPHAFSFLTHEAMFAGARGAEERDRLIALLAQEIELALSRSPDEAPTPDMPVRILLGGIIRVLGVHMRRGEDRPRELLADLLVWVDSYEVPRGAQIWRRITPGPAFLHDEGREIAVGPLAPEALPRGAPPAAGRDGQARAARAHPVRHREGHHGQRLRQHDRGRHRRRRGALARGLLRPLPRQAGGVRRHVRALLRADHGGERERLLRLRRHLAGAGVGGGTGVHAIRGVGAQPLPLRVRRVLRTGPGQRQAHGRPRSSASPCSSRRATASAPRPLRFRGSSPRPSTASVQEEVAFHIRHDRVAEVPALLPLAVYIILTPFVGVHAAREFVDRKLREGTGRAWRGRHRIEYRT